MYEISAPFFSPPGEHLLMHCSFMLMKLIDRTAGLAAPLPAATRKSKHIFNLRLITTNGAFGETDAAGLQSRRRETVRPVVRKFEKNCSLRSTVGQGRQLFSGNLSQGPQTRTAEPHTDGRVFTDTSARPPSGDRKELKLTERNLILTLPPPRGRSRTGGDL